MLIDILYVYFKINNKTIKGCKESVNREKKMKQQDLLALYYLYRNSIRRSLLLTK